MIIFASQLHFMQIKGKITHILGQQSGTSKAGKDWKKIQFVIEAEGEKPKSVLLNAMNKAVDTVETCDVGDVISANFDIESREYKGKWYTDINAWGITIEQKSFSNGQPKGRTLDSEPASAGQSDALPF